MTTLPFQELFLSNNVLDRLPKSLHRLQRLEILDVAHNQLTSVAEIKQMDNLRVLVLNGNQPLRTLSPALSSCASLHDLVVDTDTIEEPPARICELGTKAILNYLMGALSATHTTSMDAKPAALAEDALATRLFLDNEHLDRLVEQHLDASRKSIQAKTNELLASERVALERNQLAETAVRNEQDARRGLLLKEIRAQQDLQEGQINELNTQKNQNRSDLIRDIVEEEERWRAVVRQSIEVKSFVVDPWLLAQEADEQSRLLDQAKEEQQQLRRQEVLRAMQSLLATELQQVESYQRQKADSSSHVLTQETKQMHLLANVFEGYNRDRDQVVEQILFDESVQRSAVATLIARKDGRSWALVEQMRIIESHLGAISTFELAKRRDGSSEQLSDLAERRVALSQVLVELMAQQDARKRELVEMLTRMERERTDGQDFWLMKYQRLLDTQPANVNFDSRVDPELGYNFLVNGVVHCLPFLSRLWHVDSLALQEIGDEELKEAGIRSESDRRGILKSIAQFLEKRNGGGTATTTDDKEAGATVEAVAQGVEGAPDTDGRRVDQEEQLAECVICMDKRVSGWREVGADDSRMYYMQVAFPFSGPDHFPAVRTLGLL